MTHNYLEEMNDLQEKIAYANDLLALVKSKRSKEYKSYKENIKLMYDDMDRIWNDMLIDVKLRAN